MHPLTTKLQCSLISLTPFSGDTLRWIAYYIILIYPQMTVLVNRRKSAATQWLEHPLNAFRSNVPRYVLHYHVTLFH